ncbi:hypothetical protein LTR13_008350 [Exophiala sideris]|uniref:Uncharacterized protein n=1 Tax=Exophiala sideris TaxID=1016849 RepID=A0ABR0J0Z0_9EURO|nr:hypothetical protein LTR13_008350 [Exophiala sideris]KAK5053533.1 hypothetical protein LTR69_009177 [Exophiala sideris]
MDSFYNNTGAFDTTLSAYESNSKSTLPYSNESNYLFFLLYAAFVVYQSQNRGVPYRVNSKGLVLVKNLRKGYSVLTRPTYQAGSILRPLVMIYAYHTGNRVDYHDALVPIHAFGYTRVMFFLYGSIGPTTNFRKNVNSKYIYLIAVFGGAVVAVGHCSRPLAVPVYLMMVHAVGKLNFWTRVQFDWHRVNDRPLSPLLQILLKMGFCSFVCRRDVDMQITVNDGPKIGELPADALGHVYTCSGICVDEPGVVQWIPGDSHLSDLESPFGLRRQSVTHVESAYNAIWSQSVQEHVETAYNKVRQQSLTQISETVRKRFAKLQESVGSIAEDEPETTDIRVLKMSPSQAQLRTEKRQQESAVQWNTVKY